MKEEDFIFLLKDLIKRFPSSEIIIDLELTEIFIKC